MKYPGHFLKLLDIYYCFLLQHSWALQWNWLEISFYWSWTFCSFFEGVGRFVTSYLRGSDLLWRCVTRGKGSNIGQKAWRHLWTAPIIDLEVLLDQLSRGCPGSRESLPTIFSQSNVINCDFLVFLNISQCQPLYNCRRSILDANKIFINLHGWEGTLWSFGCYRWYGL